MKRTFKKLRLDIMKNLTKNSMNTMELARATKSDYRTIQRQVIWLIGEEKIIKSFKNNKPVYKKL